MSKFSEEALLENKYHSIKKRYKELYNLRIDSVVADSNDLRDKIDEHYKVHQIAVNELKKQNDQLRTLMQEIETAKDSIMTLRKSNEFLRNQIKKMDPTVRVILNYPEIKISCLSKDQFKIAVGENNQLIFELTRENNSHYKSTPIKYPNTHFKNPTFIFQSVTFDYEDLDSFCREICAFVNKSFR